MAAPSLPDPAARFHPALRSNRTNAVRRLLWRADGRFSPYIYIAPFFLLFIGFGLFPILYTGYVSLTNRELLRPGVETYTGLANYRELVGDDYFWNAVKNTFLMMVMCAIPQLVLALVVAHLLNTRLLFR